ncbi:MAG: hypothetical protein V3W14_11910 [Candidatus Neomarinimicrobiota bacterium]
MNFPQVTILHIDEIKTRKPEVNLGIIYGDHYRKQLNDQPILAWNSNEAATGAFWPHKIGRFYSIFQANYRHYQGHFENQDDHTAVGLQYSSSVSSGYAGWTFYDGLWLVSLGIAGSISSSQASANIKAFPTSSNVLMGKYFLNWLEPALGRTWGISGASTYLNPSIMASIPTKGGRRLSIYYSQASFTPTPQMDYINSSNKLELAGNRSIDLQIRADEYILAFATERPLKGSSLVVTLFNSPVSVATDNNPPAGDPVQLDFDTLGVIVGGRYGLALQLSKDFGTATMLIGMGGGVYQGELKLNTPVLGYYWDILPISHAVTGKLTGHSFSQKIHTTINRDIMNTRVSFALGYIHSRYDLEIEGDAQLEFNLLAVPIHYPLQFRLQVVQMSLCFEAGQGPLQYNYKFDQYIPFITRIDDSPFAFYEKIPDARVRHRGGGVHQVTLSYHWR